jgi:serine/threonine protein phosphatase PrpC
MKILHQSLLSAGVFDGHRGMEAADYCAAALTQHLAASWQGQATLEGALAASFVSADAHFCAKEEQV